MNLEKRIHFLSWIDITCKINHCAPGRPGGRFTDWLNDLLTDLPRIHMTVMNKQHTDRKTSLLDEEMATNEKSTLIWLSKENNHPKQTRYTENMMLERSRYRIHLRFVWLNWNTIIPPAIPEFLQLKPNIKIVSTLSFNHCDGISDSNAIPSVIFLCVKKVKLPMPSISWLSPPFATWYLDICVRLCGLVFRVPGYCYAGPGLNPGPSSRPATHPAVNSPFRAGRQMGT